MLCSKKSTGLLYLKKAVSTSEEEVESDGKEDMDESLGAIKKSRGRGNFKSKRESLEKKEQVEKVEKEEKEPEESAKGVKEHILSITKPIVEKKEAETKQVLDFEREKEKEEKTVGKAEGEAKASEIARGSDVIKDVDKGKGDMVSDSDYLFLFIFLLRWY